MAPAVLFASVKVSVVTSPLVITVGVKRLLNNSCGATSRQEAVTRLRILLVRPLILAALLVKAAGLAAQLGFVVPATLLTWRERRQTWPLPMLTPLTATVVPPAIVLTVG